MSLALLALLAAPPFTHTVAPVTREQLPHSWHPGCPVGPSSLRRLRVGYWGFDGKSRVGTLVVNRSAVGALDRRLPPALQGALPDPADAPDRRLRRERRALARGRQHGGVQLPLRGRPGPEALVGARLRARDRRRTRSRTRTWRAAESTRARAGPTSTARTSARAWPSAAGCSSARSRRSAGSGAAAGPARPTTSISPRPAARTSPAAARRASGSPTCPGIRRRPRTAARSARPGTRRRGPSALRRWP